MAATGFTGENAQMLMDSVRDCAARSVLCWLATVDREGWPQVSPKKIFALYGDTHFLIANVASPGSVRNIQNNPKVSVSFIDIFVQKGYKLKGIAEVVQPLDDCFEPQCTALRQVMNNALPIRNVIAIAISEVLPLIDPSYNLIDGTDETSQIKAAMHTYGVMPRKAQH